MLSSRHITTACFFGCIYYLLIMNWSWAAEPDYNGLTYNIERNAGRTRNNTWVTREYLTLLGSEEYFIERFTPFVEKMKMVSGKTDSLYEYIELIKNELRLIDSTTLNKNQKRKKLNQVAVKYKLNTLIPSIEEHVEFLKKNVPLSWNLRLGKLLPESDNRYGYFGGNQHLTSTITLLAVLQNCLANIEYAFINHLSNCIGNPYGCGFGTDYRALAIANNYFLFPGQKVSAQIALVVPLPETQDRSLFVTTNTGSITKQGWIAASWQGYAHNPGVEEVSGVVTAFIYNIYTNPEVPIVKRDTTVMERPFSFRYFVAAPGISINLDKAKVCYIGVNNPITVSVPGYEDEKLTLKVKGAKVVKRAAGKFNIYFSSKPSEDTYAYVEGTNSEGSTSTVASLPLKVIELPTPVATIDGAEDGYISIRRFRNAKGLYAITKDSDFDMGYTIISYKLSLFHKNNSIYIEPVKGKGPFFSNSPAVLKIQDIALRGDRAIFEDIVAIDENGRTIELAPLILKLH